MDVVNPTPERLKFAKRLSDRSRKMPSGCIEFTGRLEKGYGRVSFGPKDHNVRYQAHVLSYILFVGEVKDGNDVHHKCENKACMNPDHLEQLTHIEHKKEHRLTECEKGHSLTDDNVYVDHRGCRSCLACRRQNNSQWIRENKEKANEAVRRYRAKLKQKAQESKQ